MRLLFDVFGRRVMVESTADGWAAYVVGTDGKRGPAGCAIPSHLAAEAIAGYLDDLFHEYATPANPAVKRLD